MNTIDHEPEKSVVIPVLVALVCGAALYWAYNHISGGCTNVVDIFTYCRGVGGGVLITK